MTRTTAPITVEDWLNEAEPAVSSVGHWTGSLLVGVGSCLVGALVGGWLTAGAGDCCRDTVPGSGATGALVTGTVVVGSG